MSCVPTSVSAPFLIALCLAACVAPPAPSPLPAVMASPVASAPPAGVPTSLTTPSPAASASPAGVPTPATTAVPAASASPTAMPSTPTPAPVASPTPSATPVPAPFVMPSIAPTLVPTIGLTSPVQAVHPSGQLIGPDESEAQLLARGVPAVTLADTRIFTGYQQVSANNQNPVLVRFDQGVETWRRSDYETSGDDSRGYALIWDGDATLYAVFSSTGTQGDSSQDFRRFARNGWLRSYGAGGGPKVAVVAQIDPRSGDVLAASFLSAQLSNGNSNSLAVTDLALTPEALMITANAWYSPRQPDARPMRCTGSSPFVYRLQFRRDLRTVLTADADRCAAASPTE